MKVRLPCAHHTPCARRTEQPDNKRMKAHLLGALRRARGKHPICLSRIAFDVPPCWALPQLAQMAANKGFLLAPTPARAIHAIVNETNPLVAARMAQTPQPMRRKRPDLRAARAQAADARSRRSAGKDHHARTAHKNGSPPPRRDGPHADDCERPAFHPVSHRRLRGTGRAVPGAYDRRGESARPFLESPVHSSKTTSLRSVLVRRCGQPAS